MITRSLKEKAGVPAPRQGLSTQLDLTALCNTGNRKKRFSEFGPPENLIFQQVKLSERTQPCSNLSSL